MKYLYLYLSLSLLGCAAPQEVQRRYFWPLPPETPRIEFVASYWSSDDFPRTAKQKMLESVVGFEAARGFIKPWGIASDGEGKVYVVDTNIREVVVLI